MARWTWDMRARRYRSDDGSVVSMQTIKVVRRRSADAQKDSARSVLASFQGGGMTADGFVREIRAILKTTTLFQYLLGRGGVAMMLASDRGRVGGLLRGQYRYLNEFAGQLRDGSVTGPQAEARMDLYLDSARAAFERGQGAAWGVSLPRHPPAHPRCACSWSLEMVGRGADRVVRAYWRTNSERSCPECLALAAEYAPLEFPMPV